MLENKIITNKTCGKLYIVGEYSILTAGQSAIIKNVNIFTVILGIMFIVDLGLRPFLGSNFIGK